MDEYKPQIRNHSFIEFVSYLPLALIIVGTIGNSIIFLVFRFSKKFKYSPQDIAEICKNNS